MGVLKTGKKMSRKTRKTIRRAISGVCMASALIVALIPPEVTKAYSGTEPSGGSFAYAIEDSDEYDFGLDIDLSLYGTSAEYSDGGAKIFTTYDVEPGDRAYQIKWQYKYYVQNGNGVICAYNDTFPSPELEILDSMPAEYFKITNSDFSAFYAMYDAAVTNGDAFVTVGSNTSPSYYKVTFEPVTDTLNPPLSPNKTYYCGTSTAHPETAEKYLDKYFHALYSNFLARYETELANWNTVHNEEVNAGKEADEQTPFNFTGDKCTLKCDVKDIDKGNDDLLRRTYYCDVHYELYNDVALEDYVLTKVDDTTVPQISGSIYDTCYLAKFQPDDPSRTATGYVDTYGFLYKQRASILAIGDHAFEGVRNVERLKLSGHISYIGDYSFAESWVQSLTFENVENIGNRAFKGCNYLNSITFSNQTSHFGTECFYGSTVNSVTFPGSVRYIGEGAFAECPNLTNVDMSAITTPYDVGAFAFYNDVNLNVLVPSNSGTSSVTFGDCAFACTKSPVGSLSTVSFPPSTTSLGKYLFAGRSNLQNVNMPINLGKDKLSATVVLPEGMFAGCSKLACVSFPETAVNIKFPNPDTASDHYYFEDVINENFYVRGPKGMDGQIGEASKIRESTWHQKSGLRNADGTRRSIPYVFTEGGEDKFELSDGTYLLVVDDNGALQSCSLVDGSADNINMVIPTTVGSTPVKSIVTGCFDSLRDKMSTLVIEDNTISEIGEGAFKNFSKLKRVNIGNSVTKIGNSAFEGCTELEYVSFETPLTGYSSFSLSNIGTNAFATGGDSLIFEGDIDTSYGPFQWAMQLDNFVDADQGTRVCYKTGYPSYLTVIVDNRNGLPTLVDHPHYEDLDILSQTATDTRSYLADPEDTEPTVIPFSLTYRYEHLGEEHYDYTDPTDPVLITCTCNMKEEEMIRSALNLNVPAGIKSIDTFGFVNNSSKADESIGGIKTNTVNVTKYLTPRIVNYAIDGYTEVSSYAIDTYKKWGLFSGYFGAYDKTIDGTTYKLDYQDGSEAGSKYEAEFRGNDRIESIVLNSVTYLPKEAFYSCEKLSSITLGDSMTDLGVSPFAGCTSLTSIGSTTPGVSCENGIVYSENEDGTYNIVEILSARGKSVGSKKIKISDEDPKLANVSSIAAGAIKNCNYITGIDFTGMNLLKEIPEECFKDCKYLNQVIIPENITEIGHKAFAGTMEGIEVVFYGKEVYLPNDAFGTRALDPENDLVESKRVVSYKDSAVRKAAADLGADVTETLDDTVKVQFYDFDGKELSDVIFVNKGTSLPLEKIPDNPVREGYTFKAWNKPLTNISEDMIIVATYDANSSSTPDKPNTDKPGDNDDPNKDDKNKDNGDNNNTDKKDETNTDKKDEKTETKFYTLTVTNGNGSGSYAEGATVIITCTNPPAGKVFDKWVPTTTDLGIASVNVAATTLKMPAHEASVTATFKNEPTNTSNNKGSVSGNNSGSKNNSGTVKQNGNTIIISKSGISNTSLASASVTGSSDNYVIRITETAAATAAVEKALTNEYGSLDNIRYTAMDITLYDATGTNKITDYSGLSITLTLPIPDVMTQYAGNNKVAGVVNEKLDKLSPKFTNIDGVPCITFTATHFSPYTIYVDTANMSATGVADGTPKTGDGIHPKWFLVAGLAALSIALFFMKDKKPVEYRALA